MTIGDIIFQGDQVCARAISRNDKTTWMVTFDNFHAEEGFDHPIFGEEFCAKEDVSSVHISTHGNDWYQHDDWMSLTEAIRTICAGADSVIAYGSSMGGYAALRFAEKIGATGALVLSPQYSIDPRKVPFENRWNREADRLQFKSDIDGPISGCVNTVIVYDPFTMDRQHASMIARDIPSVEIRLPGAGHPVTTYLAEARLLGELARSFLNGQLDAPAFEKKARAKRKENTTYLIELSRLQPMRRKGMGLYLAQRAAISSSNNPLAIEALARWLLLNDEPEKAISAYDKALSLDRHPDRLIRYSAALWIIGRHEEAVSLIAVAQSENPIDPRVHFFAAKMKCEVNMLKEAHADANLALHLHPQNRLYRKLTQRIDRLRLADSLTFGLVRTFREFWAMLAGRKSGNFAETL